MKKRHIIIIIALVVIGALIFLGLNSFKNNNKKIAVIDSKSNLKSFEITNGETRIMCELTLENKTDKDMTISVKAHFTDDYKSGLVSDEYIVGEWDETGEKSITIKAGETVKYAGISFYSTNNGCDTMSSRLLPDLIIDEIE